MSRIAGMLAIVGVVFCLAYCTVETGRNVSDMAIRKAEMCRQDGGRYDFNWGSCNYQDNTK